MGGQLKYILLPAIFFVPLMALAYWYGLNLGQIGFYLVCLAMLFFLILIWSARVKAEYRLGLTLRAAFSAAVVLFLVGDIVSAGLGPAWSIAGVRAREAGHCGNNQKMTFPPTSGCS